MCPRIITIHYSSSNASCQPALRIQFLASLQYMVSKSTILPWLPSRSKDTAKLATIFLCTRGSRIFFPHSESWWQQPAVSRGSYPAPSPKSGYNLLLPFICPPSAIVVTSSRWNPGAKIDKPLPESRFGGKHSIAWHFQRLPEPAAGFPMCHAGAEFNSGSVPPSESDAAVTREKMEVAAVALSKIDFHNTNLFAAPGWYPSCHECIRITCNVRIMVRVLE